MKRWLLILLLSLLLLPMGAFAAVSTELTQIRVDTETGYNLIYMDEAGQICTATDKGYAAIVRVTGDGHTLEEYYFNEQGEPVAVSGYHGKQYLYEVSKLIQVTYVDQDHKPVKNKDGYAISKRVVDDEGHTLQAMYCDEKGDPIMLAGGQYGVIYTEYDERGRVIRFVNVDRDGNPIMRKEGYSSGKWSYDETGNGRVIMYYDLNGDPAIMGGGYSGARQIRNADNKHIGTTYLDQDGNPMMLQQGYTTAMYEFDVWDNVCTITYYDIDGKPVALSRGQYGKAFVYNGKDKMREYLIDAEGNELFLIDQVLLDNVWFNCAVAILLVILAAYLPRRLRVILLILYTLFILFMTLCLREAGSQRLNLDLFWSYREFFTSTITRKQVINNILLFIPLGALLYSLFRSPWMIAVCVLASGGIECVQLIFGIGLCELDDIVNNSFGAAAGWLTAAGLIRIRDGFDRRNKSR